MRALQQTMKNRSPSRALRAAATALCFWMGVAIAQDVVIYDDALENGFSTAFSYNATVNNGDTAEAHSGTKSVSFTATNYGALAFTDSASLSIASTPTFHFWIYGASPGGQSLYVQLYADKNQMGGPTSQAPLNSFISGGAVGANTWREVTVDLTQLSPAYNGTFNRIDIQSESTTAQPVVYVDDVSLQPASNVVDPIFANGFEGSVIPPPPVNGLTETANQSNGGMNAELFAWYDSNVQQRTAGLAYNNGTSGPGGSHGGELRQFTYHVGANVRTVNASSSGAAGFGYVVSHPKEDEEACVDGPDSSSLGHFTAGTWTRVFQGRHHAIFRFQQNYPRYCSTTGAVEHDIPVTIDWIFSTGRDNPLWAISYDLSSISANALYDDSRAPYGELLFDGASTEGGHSTIAGVGWGDEYKFASSTNPMTLQSSWTWNQTNTIPYVKLWTTAVDATMGTVTTQPISKFDQAGGFGVVSYWNKTSANGSACGGDGYVMPCIDYWPYQSVNFSFADESTATNNTRLAWGTEYGFLGQTSYHTHGSTYWGGPLPDNGASGYPQKSYSVFVVLGLHSADAVAAQVAQIETAQTLSLSATVGSVPTSGPAGVNRTDTTSYSPNGYDPVYSALVFNASSNAVTGTIGVGSGTLKNPMIIIRNYTKGAYPAAVKFGGTTLTADTDYFASLRSDKSELWITLNKNVSGAGNTFQIIP